MKPDHFFIAGAQRSGSTYLYHICAEHPQIEMAQPVKPEPKFFITDTLFERGLEYYKQQYFKGKDGARVSGEKSTSYIETEIAAKRISQCIPSAKIIFILRDPIERAISNYWFSVKNGLEILPIDQAFMTEENRLQNYDIGRISVSPFAYLKRGRYIEYVEMYEKYFREDQIYILLYEQLVRSSQCLQDLYSFLNVDSEYVPQILNTVVNSNDEKPDSKLDVSLVRYLQQYFEEPNARLSKRLKISLDVWQ